MEWGTVAVVRDVVITRCVGNIMLGVIPVGGKVFGGLPEEIRVVIQNPVVEVIRRTRRLREVVDTGGRSGAGRAVAEDVSKFHDIAECRWGKGC
jgi:hypothetical protein